MRIPFQQHSIVPTLMLSNMLNTDLGPIDSIHRDDALKQQKPVRENDSERWLTYREHPTLRNERADGDVFGKNRIVSIFN